MTIIDQYISDNYKIKPSAVLSSELGLNQKYVLSRINRIRRTGLENIKQTMNRSEEIRALNQLISERGCGWAVEIAKKRIVKLEEMQKYL